jgi:putative ABC transport system substrate-binding protein
MMPQARARIAAFAQSLQELGWTDGRGIQIAYRYGAGDPERIRKSALELLALSPEVVVAGGAISVAPLQQMSRTVPIVFAEVTDPVGAGFAASLVRPGGNATGFSNFEYGFSAKWLELLKEIAPGITRVAVLRDSTLIASMSQMAAIQSIAPSFGVDLTPIDTHDVADIEHAVGEFARKSNCGLIVVTGTSAITRREAIVSLAALHRVPAVYPYRYYAEDGGLIS